MGIIINTTEVLASGPSSRTARFADPSSPEFGIVLGLHPVERIPGMPASYVGITAEVDG